MTTCSISPSMIASSSSACPRVRHILTGTFNTPALHLLSFDTLTRALVLLQTIPARGPHQFLALGATQAARQGTRAPDRVYATTWGTSKAPELSSWKIDWRDEGEKPGVSFLNARDITATSSYVHVQPPPFTSYTSPSFGLASSATQPQHLYSAGGPTGEVHEIDAATGEIGEKTQELIFLRGGEEELKQADKTRKALRFGAHNVDVGKGQIAYVADLGRNAILTYSRDERTGALTLLHETPSPRPGDGPRHVVPSADGRWAFSVTEHTSYVDAFRVLAGGALQYAQSVDLLPSHEARHDFRGDTLRVSPDGQALLATTRGMTSATRGYVRAWALHLDSDEPLGQVLATYQTPTSGGKANALEWAVPYPLHRSAEQLERAASNDTAHDYAVLTDDEKGHVCVLLWTGEELQELARVTLTGTSMDGDGAPEGASHAIWLS